MFFNEGTSEEAIAAVGEQIKARPEVARVEYESAEEAWEKFKEEYFDGSEAAEGFKDDNPLVNHSNYQVYMKDIEKQGELVAYVESLENVRVVYQSEQAANTLGSINRVVSYVSVAVIVILLAISVFLISNTVSVGIAVRSEEIGIMKFIGATDTGLSEVPLCWRVSSWASSERRFPSLDFTLCTIRLCITFSQNSMCSAELWSLSRRDRSTRRCCPSGWRLAWASALWEASGLQESICGYNLPLRKL